MTKEKKKSKSNSKAKSHKAKSSSIDSDNDIVGLILTDHKALREMIETLKDEDEELEKKAEVFEQFAPTLIAHAKPEEKTLYLAMKEIDDLRSEGFEGEVEHTLADQLVEEIKRTRDEDEWMAKVKVLAELVEHHIEEEEEELLPNYKKESSKEDRFELGIQFLDAKAEIESEGSDDAPPESMIEPEAS